MSLKFTPPKQIARYALYIEYSNDTTFFKLYHRLGDAKNAFHARTYHSYNSFLSAKILEMVDGEWYVLYDATSATSADNVPWKKTRKLVYKWGQYREALAYEIERGEYETHYVAVPMSREEYAEWRVKVFAEQHGIIL